MKNNSRWYYLPDETLDSEYKYDSKGNWIERITYKSEVKIPTTITERIIEYYE